MTIVILTRNINHAQITCGAEFLSWICHIQTISVRWVDTSLAGLASITHAKTSTYKSIKFANLSWLQSMSKPFKSGSLNSTTTHSKPWPCYAKFHHILIAPGYATTPHKHCQLRSIVPQFGFEKQDNSTHQFVLKVQNKLLTKIFSTQKWTTSDDF